MGIKLRRSTGTVRHRSATTGRAGRKTRAKGRKTRITLVPHGSCLCAPPVDGAEQEQPDHINKMPIPSRGLKAKMMVRFKVALARPEIAHDQEGSADDNVEAVETGRHVEG